MREQWTECQEEINKFEDITTDLDKLENYANKIYSRCVLRRDNREDVMNILEAISHLEGCISTMKSIIDPDGNPLIDLFNTRHIYGDLLEEYISNMMAIIDLKSQEIKRNIRESEERIITTYVVTITVKMLSENIRNHLEDLILSPLMNAIRDYKKYQIYFDDKTDSPFRRIKKGMEFTKQDLFEYLLFREVFIAVKIKGSTLRQKVATSMSATAPSFHETKIIKPLRQTARSQQIKREETEKRGFYELPPDIRDFKELYDGEEVIEDDETENTMDT
mgnify:CR=1 FL=1